MHNAVVASHNIWVRAVEACSPHDFQASAPQCITIRALDALWRTLNLGGAQCTKPLKNGIPGYPTPTHHSYRNSPPPSSSSPIYLRLLSHYNPPPLLPPPTLPPSSPPLHARERRRSVARIVPSRPKWRRRSLA